MKFQNEIKKNCHIEFGANLTSNTFYYILMDFKKIQIAKCLLYFTDF